MPGEKSEVSTKKVYEFFFYNSSELFFLPPCAIQALIPTHGKENLLCRVINLLICIFSGRFIKPFVNFISFLRAPLLPTSGCGFNFNFAL